ncbi:MAG: Os1348 family NHLP clan protein [Armatimonadota bacterium]|nr:Os1348 family NHLP clan protein [Armatimonadota bacterium]MDR7450969.1 Os1348 family NHLP clan protein [Armatimonadota bacterium]MDR7466010.1 Os1348 family NHLP clan protein [Armatimonadota bacterium]MDR7494075.1 Os1348 family NHLP clan protein [Armatimonadota bacterium]MDR7504058.1 Os1348 family NHLP clan protein [Armatimonadota bacterium]
MSLEAVAEVLARAVEDAEFRTRLVEDPAGAVAGYALSPAEIASFRDGELRRLVMERAPGTEMDTT